MHKALIVDDEIPVRVAVTKLGNWKKWHIETPILYAENGKEALKVLMEVHPCLVFVDMQMPIMNGVQFMERARELAPDLSCRFIIVSGYDTFDYAKAGIRYGATDYLLKPVVADELNEAIGRAMQGLFPSEDFGDSQEKKQSEFSADEVTELVHTAIETRYSENLKIQEFADKYYFSREYLSRLFKNRYGIGIYEYLTKVRMDRAKSLLHCSSDRLFRRRLLFQGLPGIHRTDSQRVSKRACAPKGQLTGSLFCIPQRFLPLAFIPKTFLETASMFPGAFL